MRLSIVIPTFQEAAEIEAAIVSARAVADEVIVVDAASPDGTAELARAAGARVVVSGKGRGQQLVLGARAASGDVLMFLHADARVPIEARAAIEKSLADPAVVGGNFYLRFEPQTRVARLFTWGNDVRRRVLRIYYGDSAIFVRRPVYEAMGGFRPLPIMEDFEFVQRLEQVGVTRYVRDVVTTVSARRFSRSPLRALIVWVLIQSLYSSGVSAARLAPLYRDLRS